MSYYGPSGPQEPTPGGRPRGSYGWQPSQPGDGYPPPNYAGYAPYVPVAQPGVLPLRQLTLGDYFSALFAAIRKSPGLFFGAALIFGSIAAIIEATGSFFILRNFGPAVTDPYLMLDQLLSGASSIGFFGSILLSQMVLVVGQTFNWGMYSILVGRGAVGMTTSLSQGFRLLRGQWGKLLGLLALLVAAITAMYGLMVLFIFGVAAISFTGGQPETGLGITAAVLGMLGAVLGPGIVAIFLAMRWYLVIPALVVEDIGVFSALRRSWRLTRGHFWRTLGIVLLFGLILGIVSSIIIAPLNFISGLVLMSAGTEGELVGSMLVVSLLLTAVSSLVTFAVTNMGVLVAVLFYYDYRFRKEGLGLHFQQLAAQHSSTTAPDRFDTSGRATPAADDTVNDLVPGRTADPRPPAGPAPSGPSYPSGFTDGPRPGQQPPGPAAGPPPPQPPGPGGA